MKQVSLLFNIVLLAFLINVTQAFGTDIYRLLDPVNGGRYGKSPAADPPFLRYGSTQQYYHIVDTTMYNDYTSAVSGSFSSWNNAGSVQFISDLSSGLALDTFYDNSDKNSYPYIVNPGQAYTAHGDYIINTSNSYVELNTYHDWGTVEDLQNDDFDVETILVHELGHIQGLAHPLTNSYTHNATAPIMAGGDNEYFWNHTAKSLKTDDINGTRFLQYNIWVPEQCSTIQTALANAFSGVTIHVTSSQTLSSNLTVQTGVTLAIKSDATIYLGSYDIHTTSGTITVESGAVINSLNSHVRLTTGSTINGLYPTIASAVAAGSSGQTFEIYGPHTLTANYSIPSVVSLSVKSGATLTFGSYSIVSSGGTITVASDATLSPDARRKSGSTILGLYPSITSALSAASSGQTVEASGSHTVSSNLTVTSGVTLTAKAGSTLSFGSGYYLSVSGTLNASGMSASRATFTRSGASGTWGGIRYQSGSSGTLSYGTISYGTYGVYLNSSSPDVDHCNISSCSYGIYCTGASPDITNNTISSSSYGIYCTSASPNINNNTVSGSSTYGLYVYNGSPDLETNQVTGSQVYMNACDSYMYDNYFANASSCNQALYLYGSSPSLFNNTIDPSNVMLAINITNDSDPWFGDDPGHGHNYIYNENNEADGVIWATNYSNPILGYGDAGPYIGGSNSIIGVTGIYPATAFNNSSIDAAWCWWGQYPAPACYGNVDTHDALSSNPGGGSSLAKSTYLAGDIIVDESVSSPADSLYKIGMSLFVEKQYESAIPVFKKLIVDYPDTKYASKAISMVMRIGRTYDKLDRVAWIDELLDQIDNDNLTAALKGRKVLLYRQSGRIDEAMELSAEIAKENPETLFESAALFDLFNMYQKDLGDSVSAGEILTELKTKYPDDDQTIIARSDCGENVTGALMKRHTLPKPEQQPVALTPTEYSLSQAFPNPFNPVTTFGYTIPEKSPVRLEVFDLKGRLIETLVNQVKEPGNYQVTWNASEYPSGVYLYKIQAGTYTETRKCLLIK